MAEPILRDVFLLECHFELWPDRGSTGQEESVEEATDYPSEDLLETDASALRDEDRLTFFVYGSLEDSRLPFRLSFEVGAAFSVTADFRHDDPAAQGVLLALVYPYLRELVSHLTGRCPIGAYMLPPRAAEPRLEAPSPGAQPQA